MGPDPPAPPAATRFFGERLGQLLADIPDLCQSGAACALNAPYLGGWAMRLYGGGDKPWLMVELSRALYIGSQESDSPIVPPNHACCAKSATVCGRRLRRLWGRGTVDSGQ
ncbi:MAG: N-formylglutamate amidohydrolase [Chloroflexi bacterium]|nr:N-formylglutamate amidohydrolase [Chloroflexota bacterium]